MTLNDAKFVRNVAGGSGLAIMSLGIIEDIFNTTFESNTYFCPAGMYGYDVGEDDEKVTTQKSKLYSPKDRRCF